MTQDEAFEKLEEYRQLIDDVDRRIVALLNERTLVVEEIGRVKREARLPVYEPRREDQVFQNIDSVNRGPLSKEALRRVFERIIDEMRIIQRLRMQQQQAREAARQDAGTPGPDAAGAPGAAGAGTGPKGGDRQ